MMGIKQIPIYICDFCDKHMKTERPFIITEDVLYEGCSVITNTSNKKYYNVGGQHYCCIECVLEDIKEHLQ